MLDAAQANRDAGRPPSTMCGVWPTLIVALVGLLGSLWLSIGMGLRACPLCFYQRTFVMGVVGVLVVGLLIGERYGAVLNLLVLPLAVAGFGVAVFHTYLELTGKLECPSGVAGVGSAPQQSLAVLVVLLVAVGNGIACAWRPGESSAAAPVLAVALGVLFVVGSIASSPPMPPAPAKPYQTPLDICRPPYRPPQ